MATGAQLDSGYFFRKGLRNAASLEPQQPLLDTWFFGQSGASYTLTADSGAFALTGQAAGLKRGLNLVAASGSFALTGQVAGLRRGLVLASASGSYSLTGQAANLRRGYAFSAASGSISLAGQSAVLRAARLLTSASGAFALTGQDATLTKSSASVHYTLTASGGAYSLSAWTVSLIWSTSRAFAYPLVPGTGSAETLSEETASAPVLSGGSGAAPARSATTVSAPALPGPQQIAA